MTESAGEKDIFPGLTRHEALAVGTRFGHRRAAEQCHDVSWHLPHGKLSQIRGVRSGRSEKELRLAHALVQSGEVSGLSRARNHNVDLSIAVRAKALGEVGRGNDVVFRKHHDERDPGRVVRCRRPYNRFGTQAILGTNRNHYNTSSSFHKLK
jgi:hypothetical protein